MAKVRLADIAAQVGVSTVTVHNALTGQKGVSDELRARIQKVAGEMGYRPVSAARRQERSRMLKSIGVLIHEKYLAEYTTFYWKMYQELALVATDKNCMAVVEILKHDMEDHLLLPRMVEENQVEGLIVMGEISKDYIHFMKEQTKLPIIFLDFYDKELSEDSVIADNFYGMYLLTEYLFERGYQKLAYVGSIHRTSSIMDRYCGFYKALLEHGEELPAEWLIEDRDRTGNVEFSVPEKLPEAFVCNCDLTAGILMMKLEEMGYKIPGDVAVIGFDNFLYPGFPDKKITTYEVNTRAMVKIALEKVMKRLKNPSSGRGLNVVFGQISRFSCHDVSLLSAVLMSFSIVMPRIPMTMMYSSIGAASNELLRLRMRMPRPAIAPVDSAAISVVSATEAPRRMAVRMNGRVAGAMTRMKISLSVAPSTRAALISVSSTLMTP